MPRKVLIIALVGTILALGGCTRVREESSPAPAVTTIPYERVSRPAGTSPSPSHTSSVEKPAVAAEAVSPPRVPQPDLPSLIQASSLWLEAGGKLLVTRGPSQPVPLFRQAIVLASVRSAVAGSPATPRAEFRNGRLTLSFERGTNPEIAAAVNRALSVPEVTRLEVHLPAARPG